MRVALAGTLVAGALVLPASAGAATQLGETFDPSNLCGNPMVPTAETVFLQVGSPGNRYAAPFAGVITGWSYQSSAGHSPVPFKLKVARLLGGNSFLVVGESSYRTPPPNALNSYTDVRIPVEAGDVIGFAVMGSGGCSRSAPGYLANSNGSGGGDVPPGGTGTFFGPPFESQLDVAAVLEPDCDKDGFGDESQDPELDPSVPACDPVAPQTTITGGPKDKTRKKRAVFQFSGTDSRALSGFECSLDGGAYAPCASPHPIKVKRGKHTFSVRSTDRAGNVDSSPATDTWKVKRKRKKNRK